MRMYATGHHNTMHALRRALRHIWTRQSHTDDLSWSYVSEGSRSIGRIESRWRLKRSKAGVEATETDGGGRRIDGRDKRGSFKAVRMAPLERALVHVDRGGQVGASEVAFDLACGERRHNVSSLLPAAA